MYPSFAQVQDAREMIVPELPSFSILSYSRPSVSSPLRVEEATLTV